MFWKIMMISYNVKKHNSIMIDGDFWNSKNYEYFCKSGVFGQIAIYLDGLGIFGQ